MSGLDVGHEAVRTAAQCSATSWGAISAASSFKIATAGAKKSHWIRMCCSSLSGTCWLVSAVSAQKSGGLFTVEYFNKIASATGMATRVCVVS